MSKRKRDESSSGAESSRRQATQDGLDEKKSKKGRSQKSNEQTVADFSEFSNRYERIFESGEDADVTFIVNDQEIRAHKLILSAHSEYFKNMFKSAWAERTAQVIKKPNVDYEAFREVIRFLYCGKARLDPRNVMIAAKIGLELSLDDFLELCCDCIKSTVSIDNVLDYLIEIDKISPLKLASAKQACMNNIVENTAKFFERYNTRLTEAMMIEILQNDDLCIKESQLFQYVVVWGRHIQLEARKAKLAQAGSSSTIYHSQYLKPLSTAVSGNSDASSGTTTAKATITNAAGETTTTPAAATTVVPAAAPTFQLQQPQPVDDIIMADVSAMFHHPQPQITLQAQPVTGGQNLGAVTTISNQNTENAAEFVDTSSIVLTKLRQLPEEEREELKNILKKPMQRIKFPCMTPAFVKLVEKAGIVDPTLIFETYKYHALKDITATNFLPSFELMRGNNVLQIGPNRWRYTIRLSDLHKNEHIQSNNYTYEGMEWYLLVYLIRKNFLEMYVCIDEDKVPPGFDKLTVKIQFSVTNRLDNAKSTILKLKEYTFTKAKCEYNWGSKKIMERSLLEDPRNGFVLNDTIMVEYGVKKIA